MKIRDFIFWPHLVVGVLGGLIILSLGVTGFLLTFERQVIDWADTQNLVAPAVGAPVLPLDELVTRAAANGIGGSSVMVMPEPGSAVGIREGRRNTWVNPWDGTAIPRNEAVGGFFGTMTAWHRWLGADPDNRDLPRSIVNIANVMFGFLALSGIYLWLPRVWNSAMLRSRVFFRRGLKGKARDFNWHHAFAFWALIPLVLVIYTGMMMHYPWARNLANFIAGAEPQQQGGQRSAAPVEVVAAGTEGPALSLDELRDVAAGLQTGWKRLQIDVPGNAPNVSVMVDTGPGNQVSKQTTYVLDKSSGAVVSVTPYDDLPIERKVGVMQRFGHTGEAFGLIGQIVFGLASLASALMAYTGLALAWRRLILPLFRKKAAASRREATSPATSS